MRLPQRSRSPDWNLRQAQRFGNLGADPRHYSGPSCALIDSSSVKNGTCPGTSLRRALWRSNHSPRSTSGNSCCLPDFGGHSIQNMLLRNLPASTSPATAQADMTFPLGWLSGVNGTKAPAALNDVSSVNSRFAASSASASPSYSPLGIDHEASSFFAQKGPPGCTRNTSN